MTNWQNPEFGFGLVSEKDNSPSLGQHAVIPAHIGELHRQLAGCNAIHTTRPICKTPW